MRVTSEADKHLHSARAELMIRECREDEANSILTIINKGAEAYRGVIPSDCWHEPYMSAAELRSEIVAGVSFIGYEIDGEVAGVMGIQTVRNADLVRHAYVLPAFQGRGVGSALISHLRTRSVRQLLVGTWSAATWAIDFYKRHGFQLVSDISKAILLQTYWTISERQIETSVVLAAPHLTNEKVVKMVAEAKAICA